MAYYIIMAVGATPLFYTRNNMTYNKLFPGNTIYNGHENNK